MMLNNEIDIFESKVLGLYLAMHKTVAGAVKIMPVKVNELTIINNTTATMGIQSNKKINSTRRIIKTLEHLQEGITVADILK